MTTKELIQQYVTAHADNRWMDASELEALLTEFAEKLQEPASEDLEQAAEEYVTKEGYLAGLHYNSMVRSFKAGANWQREQMMKDAVEGRMKLNHIVVSYAELAKSFPTGKDGDKVKVIIIKGEI